MNMRMSGLVLRWIARIWSLLSIGFVILFAVAAGLDGEFNGLTAGEYVGLAMFPIGVGVGLIVAWFREGLGGMIALGCFVIFYLSNLVSYGGLPGGPFFFLVAAPGIPFVLSWLLTRRRLLPETS